MSESFTDSYIRQQIRVENLKEGEAEQMAAILRNLQDKFLRRLDRDMTLTRTQKNAIIRAYNAQIAEAYGRIGRELRRDGREATARAARWHERTLVALGAVGEELTNAQIRRLYERAIEQPYDGRVFPTWLADAEAKDKRLFQVTLNRAFVEGTNPVPQLRDNFNISLRDTKAITRSYFGHLAATTRNQVFEEYQIAVVQWLSTLDGRTTHICMVRDGLHYTVEGEPVDHGYEWGSGPGSIHWNCRSTAVPVLPEEDVTFTRPAVAPGENYEKGDLTTQRGRVRKPTKPNRESGKLKFERVNTDTNYSKWLQRQPADYQDEILGIERGKQFRESGDLSQVFKPDSPIVAAQF